MSMQTDFENMRKRLDDSIVNLDTKIAELQEKLEPLEELRTTKDDLYDRLNYLEREIDDFIDEANSIE